ncbi:serine/threonine protein kinase [Myxococcus sp. CA051A]|uniref:Serine/threonine protein kinase n=1 Tax=Myxococcus llanfairpwllgwyngyllgogerychwyrndrobwllllantysiliogogogochensis TaxID=2590453 RepID=A0A540X581_9BACT|nr:serine/threonine-protein kinase [Myxococcus llanfairpwllgwyngyllgogerychwyrndrobwllllantysiliogogogochensis]NTX05066.1 serine/threonine protein kinase [Myxococcus sp. CA040A]NTX61476.1 serine/threonine protein kinase [Myxococcus sp. CA051A]TQF16408.1 serine/threonine protein kinase [Myxococcus llanfairpwllgwyngyllgogerychwyrndrobwllllantysiliogogogochensis]
MAEAPDLGGYEVVGRLAVGGMAEVYQAKARSTTQRSPGEPDEVVIKRLHPSFRNDTAYVKAFVDEAKLTVRLRHAHIVRTFRLFKAGPDYLMVQELVSGRTLGYMQELLLKAGAAMPPESACYIAWCMLKALDYIHRAKVGENGATIVHRDMNPANVLLGINGDVKVTDFGVAEVEGMMRGDSGALRGTLPYMSPEQVLGQAVDARTDLYAVGVILWELFASRRLHSGENESDLMHQVRDARVPLLSSVTSDLPDYAVQVVRKALFADRVRRFQSAAEFIKALEALSRRAGWPLTVEALQPLLGG